METDVVSIFHLLDWSLMGLASKQASFAVVWHGSRSDFISKLTSSCEASWKERRKKMREEKKEERKREKKEERKRKRKKKERKNRKRKEKEREREREKTRKREEEEEERKMRKMLVYPSRCDDESKGMKNSKRLLLRVSENDEEGVKACLDVADEKERKKGRKKKKKERKKKVMTVILALSLCVYVRRYIRV